MKCSQIIADCVSKARWSWDCVSVLDPRGRRQRMRLFIRQGTAICLFRFGMLAMFGGVALREARRALMLILWPLSVAGIAGYLLTGTLIL
jgi:hypothetical protein